MQPLAGKLARRSEHLCAAQNFCAARLHLCLRLLLLVLVFVLSLRTGANGEITLLGLIVLALLVRAFCINYFEFLIILLGFLTPLLPCMGTPILMAFALFVFAIAAPKIEILRWGKPFLCVCWGYTIIVLIRDFWAHDFSSVLSHTAGEIVHTWVDVRESLRISPFPAMLAFEHSSRWLTLCLIAAALLNRRELVFKYLSAATIGFVCCFGLGILEHLKVLPFDLPKPGAFWLATGRPAFTLTDPNALGIIALLILVSTSLLKHFSRERAELTFAFNSKQNLIALMAFCAGVFSGSRTFFFGLFIWSLLVLWNKKPRWCFVGLGIFAAFVISLNLIFNISQINQNETYVALAPIGMQRVFASLSFSDFNAAYSSRVIFNLAAFKMWLDHPIFGVGIGQFLISAQPYLPNTAGWSDNANNFYLGLLAETGLFGFAAFVLPLLRVKLQIRGDSVDAVSTRILVVFFCTLILGPHLEFDEIVLFVGVLISLLPPTQEFMAGRALFTTAALAAILVLPINSFGTYPLEVDGTQWTAKHARFERSSTDAGIVTLDFQVLNPIEANYPISITVTSSQGEVRNIVQAKPSAETHHLEFQCLSAVQWYVAHPCKLHISLDVSATWAPAWLADAVDRRMLGVRLINLKN